MNPQQVSELVNKLLTDNNMELKIVQNVTLAPRENVTIVQTEELPKTADETVVTDDNFPAE